MAVTFHDVRLPTDIERGALGGPRFDTAVFEATSGFEQRNINWSQTRGEWDVGYGILQRVDPNAVLDVDDLINFFYTRRGRGFSFRFKDWSDYLIGDPDNPTTSNQQIGLGDDATVTFQVFKQYLSGGITFDRNLTKLVSGRVVVLLDNVVQSSGFTLDFVRGTVTFDTAPASTGGTGPGGEEVVSVALEFDNHVRFDTDSLQISMEMFNAGSWPNIPIVELRSTGVD